MFIYQRPPIDYWEGWIDERDYRQHLAERCYDDGSGAARAWSDYETLRSNAFELARDIGWEGDTREGPYIAGLPGHDVGHDGQIMIAFKQNNNGTTFIASSYQLPWLKD